VSVLDFVVSQVASMKPGQCVRVDRFTMRDIPTSPFVGWSEWRAPDRVLDRIMGSAYEFGYTVDSLAGYVTFWRLAQPLTDGRRSYVEPDRRDFFEREGDLWRLKSKPSET